MHTSFEDIIKKLDDDALWDFPGGIYPAGHKEISNQQPIAQLPIAKQLYVTVKQHIGVEGSLIVKTGQNVLKGQPLTRSTNPYSVPVHAPTSGLITAIEKHVSAHPSGIPELTVVIQTDQKDEWTTLTPLMDYQALPKVEVLAKICESGISGMGGAGFPSHIKLSSDKEVEFLVINGVECEPYITADDRLMREHAWQIRQGIDILYHLLSPKKVLIAIENNKPHAIEAMQIACRENPLYKVVEVPTKYPSGGEKQLIQILTNREVPAKGLPIDVGIISQNVGTCYAISDAIFTGKPLIQRVVTVTGQSVNKPNNYWTLIGTPTEHLLQHSEYQAHTQKQPKVVMGGPMMGFSVANDLVPVVKITNCILVPSDQEALDSQEQACIRCGACADACPASLLPQQLFWHAKAKEHDKAQDYNLFDCIECGACAYVCPSQIPLVHYYRIAKADIRAEQAEKQLADKARERFESRAARLQAEQQARDEKHRLAAEARKQAMSAKGNDAKDKIAAALARAKAKKQSLAEESNQNKDISSNKNVTSTKTQQQITKDNPPEPSASIDTTTDNAASPNQRVQAAIARAKAKKLAAQKQTEQNEQASLTAIESKTEEKSERVSGNPIPATDDTVQPSKPTKLLEDTTAKKSTLESNKEQQALAADIAKQAKVAAAVAKAKARRATQQKSTTKTTKIEEKPAIEQPDKTSGSKKVNDPLEVKKRRIAAAVAKAKAKKLAEKQQNNQEDKNS